MKTIPSFLVQPLRLATHSRRDIAQRASAIWRQVGRPADRDVPIWLQAEREIIAVGRRRTQVGADRRGGANFARSGRHASVTSV